MKISEVNLDTIKAHCGVSDSDSDGLLEIYRSAAYRQILDYTGLSAEQADELPDLAYALLAIVGEMFSTREMRVEYDRLNPMAKQIMDLHTVNLL